MQLGKVSHAVYIYLFLCQYSAVLFRSVSDHAKTKFPPNVTCKTGHALAFGVTGRRYSAAQKLGNLTVYGLTQTLKNRKGHNLFVRAKFVLDTINHFLCSAEQFIRTAHCPDVQIDEKTGRRTEITHADKMVGIVSVLVHIILAPFNSVESSV